MSPIRLRHLRHPETSDISTRDVRRRQHDTTQSSNSLTSEKRTLFEALTAASGDPGALTDSLVCGRELGLLQFVRVKGSDGRAYAFVR